jgi:hypothetical protein
VSRPLRSRRRRSADYLLLAGAWVVHAIVAAACAVVPFRAISKYFLQGRRTADGRRDAALDVERRIVWAVQTAAYYWPGSGSCLTEALTARWLLDRHGLESTLVFGVAPGPERSLSAHALLERSGRLLIGGDARGCHQPLSRARSRA